MPENGVKPMVGLSFPQQNKLVDGISVNPMFRRIKPLVSDFELWQHPRSHKWLRHQPLQRQEAAAKVPILKKTKCSAQDWLVTCKRSGSCDNPDHKLSGFYYIRYI